MRSQGAAGGAGPSIEFLAADGPLNPFVESYYLYRHDGAALDGIERVDTGHIRFLLKGSSVRTFADGHGEPSLDVMVNGPGTAATNYHLDGPFLCFGLTLRAIGWRALIGLPAHQVSDTVLDGVGILGPEALALLVRLRRLHRLEDMARAAEPLLVSRLKPVPRQHVALARAVREWAASGEPGIEGLFARVDMSRRQATRLCNDYFGGPPKLLERKYRAIRAAMTLYRGGDPKDAAARFSDQPHMIKELKRFTGHTPTTLKESIDPMLAMTLENDSFGFLPDVIPESG